MEEEFIDPEVQEYFKPDLEYESLDRDEIICKLEDGAYLEEIKNSESWRIFREAWRRIYKSAEVELDNINPSNTARIAELQVTKRFYKNLLPTIIKKIKEDGKSAFEHAEERGFLGKLMMHLKKDI